MVARGPDRENAGLCSGLAAAGPALSLPPMVMRVASPPHAVEDSLMDALFRVLTLALCDGNDIGQGLRQAVGLLREHFPVSRLSLTAASSPDGRGVVRIVAESDEQAARRIDVLVPLSMEAASWTSEITTDDVMIVDDPEAHPLFRLLNDMEDGNSGSLLIGPLGIGRRPVGCLTVFGPTRGCYTEEHARLLKAVNEPFAIALEHHLQRDRLLHLQHQLLEDRRELERDLWSSCSDTIIGEHFGLRDVMTQLRRVAPSPAPVLLLGETGVGKDVLANAVHRRSARSTGPFVKLNCGALSENLVDSELFGHEAGAFTARAPDTAGASSGPKEARCFWTRSESYLLRPNCACCVSSNTARSNGWADRKRSKSTSGSSRRLTAICEPWSARALFGKTCGFAWTCSRSAFHRCASAEATFRRWPTTFCGRSRPASVKATRRSSRRTHCRR